MPYHPMGSESSRVRYIYMLIFMVNIFIYRTVPWMLYCYMGNESQAHFWIIMDGFPSPWTSTVTIDTNGQFFSEHRWPRNNKTWGYKTPVSETNRCGRGPPGAETTKNKNHPFFKASNWWSPMVRSSSTNCLPARISRI